MAIDDLLDEHEQSERVRTWLRQNASGLIGGVALGLAAIYGWFWWQDQNTAKRTKASDDYQVVLEQIKAGNLKDAQAKTGALKETSFAALAALDPSIGAGASANCDTTGSGSAASMATGRGFVASTISSSPSAPEKPRAKAGT